MHPKDHPVVSGRNLLELFLQAPFWIIFYGTGLTFVLQMATWVLYGMGWYVHPRKYPMPHAQLMEFYAESVRWLRTESNLSRQHPKIAKSTAWAISTAVFIALPVVFVKYCHYIAWLYLGGAVTPFQAIWRGIFGS